MKTYTIRKIVKDAISKSEIISALKTARIPEGAIFEIGDEHKGWLVQIQNHRQAYYLEGIHSPKISSMVLGRIWLNGKMVFKIDDKEMIARDKMIKFLQSSIEDSAIKDDENEDIAFLIKDEEDAIAGYKERIARTTNPSLASVFSHILTEEVEHLEELRNAQAGIFKTNNDD